MSPANAMDRSYGPIKQMLRQGIFASGARLEANRLADELGVSITPVRDVLYRLTGELLVDATIGDGFHVPRFSEAGLRDLYEWQSALISFAGRTVDVSSAMAVVDGASPVADRIAEMIGRVAATAPNKEIGSALIAASDRLQPFRIAESKIFDDVESEFAELSEHEAGAAGAIRRYHLRRMRAVSALLQLRDQR
ncbi:MAG: GntR family transcriptional regulator [Pseudomonadota bacterium]|nr:GntR family transcriptional regulator [Pseudomonadota bacterium]